MHAASTGEGTIVDESSTRAFPNDDAFFGQLYIEYGSAAEGEEDVNVLRHVGKGYDLPIGIGTELQLVAWARGLRTDDDFFPPGIEILAVYIGILPTVNGRIPWERDERLSGGILLLEGTIPEGSLGDDDDTLVRRVPAITTH